MAFGSPQWMYSAGKYEIDQSLKFEDGRSTYLSRTPAADGNRKTWTLSYWIKRGGVADHKSHFGGSLSGTASVGVQIQFDGGTQQLLITDYRAGYNVDWNAKSNMGFRDLSGWYHIVIAVDTTQSTASDRVKLYANGELLSLTTYNAPSQNFDTKFNQNSIQVIGAATDNLTPTNFYEGYMSEINFLDGIVATPANFGETGTYGEWKPKEYSGTYGTNGYYLPMKQDYTVEGFSTVTWRGNGVSGNYIGGTGFKPDFTWIKQRSGVYSHVLADSVRGNGKFLSSANTGVEDADNTKFQNFATDGFTVGTHAGVNSSGQTYVGWNWDMGADTPTGFTAVAYKGNATARSIGGVGFSPDLVWNATRSANQNKFVYDRIRGAGKELRTNSSNAEGTNDGVLAFEPDGFRRGSSNDCNENGITYVDWCWYMGNTSVTNTDGSLTSTVMASTTYGQSIVSYTGNGAGSATVGHGLNSAPEMMIVRTTGANAWAVYHASIGNTHLLEINTTAAKADNNTFWNDTSPTSSVFTIGSHGEVNANNAGFIAYCFHSVSGYSKFSSYTGNGSSTGPTITTGFRPAFVMIKNSSNTGGWEIWDSTRNPLNPLTNTTQANLSNTELTSGRDIEFTDTGFQIKNTTSNSNTNGDTYIYMAFAGGMDSISDYNTDGSSDSRVKANTTYGQSIVTYKGKSGAQTIGHGLSSAPEMIIAKNRSSAQEWLVYHHSITDAEQKYLRLDTDGAVADNTFWNDTAPTSSVFSVGDSQPINSGHGNDYVAYCWHSVTGYSKFGSYTGNGSTTGPTVTLGFRPAFVLLKPSSAVDHWNIYDTTRDPQNPINHLLFPNRDNAEGTGQDIEISDTGFQLKTNNTGSNGNGTTYIYMAFADKREYAYWLDQSGNNNDWTSNNLTDSDISVDSPSNNFATLNPLAIRTVNSPTVTYSEGNTKATIPIYGEAYGNMFPTTGKWYTEVLVQNIVYALTIYGAAPSMDSNRGNTGGSIGYHSGNGNKYVLGADSSYGDTYTTGDIIGIAVDLDGNSVTFYKNNVSQGAISGSLTAGVGYGLMFADERGGSVIINHGQDSSFAGNKTAQGNQDGNDIGDFYYTPPTGFLALCTDNLPDVAVTPSEHFNTLLYTGDASANRSITGVGFAPDFVWAKERNNTAHHVLVDSVRGTSSGGRLSSNRDNAEDNTGGVTIDSFDSDGFTTGSSYAFLNGSTPFVAWNWKANGSGSSNSNGSITSTVSANTDAGFSIIKYHGNATAGATIGHGLSKAPELVICKDREAANGWGVGAFNENNTKALYLASTGAFDTNNYWNSTNPSSTVITLGVSGAVNANNEMIAYAWHSVDGYSKVGSYTGNGNANGTFIYTGFRPAFVILKPSSRTGHWMITNNKSTPYNVVNKVIFANASSPEYTNPTAAVQIDYLSNGFKVRTTDDNSNENAATYVFMAFAETPFKYSNAR